MNIIIRADGSEIIGHGHIFRTLALSHALARHGHNIIFCCRNLPGAPLKRIIDCGYDLCVVDDEIDESGDAEITAKYAKKKDAKWIIVDRYTTLESAYSHWKKQGIFVAVIDDIAIHRFDVHLLINQNSNAKGLNYNVSSDATRLFGPNYAMVRKEYCVYRPVKPVVIDSVKRVMVFMGGGDYQNSTGSVVRALVAANSKLEVKIVLGSANPHAASINSYVSNLPSNINVETNLPNLASIISWADCVIVSGGSTLWELATIGTPAFILSIADNQIGVSVDLAKKGAAVYFGQCSDICHDELVDQIKYYFNNCDKINLMAKAIYNITDGKGARRVALALE